MSTSPPSRMSSSQSFQTAALGLASYAPNCSPNLLKRTNDSYFGNDVYESPDNSDDDEDAHSESTCEDDGQFSFGAPLERMPRHYSQSSGVGYDMNQQVSALLKVSPCSSGLPSRAGSFISDASSSTTNYDTINYDGVVDEMLSDTSNLFLQRDTRNLAMFNPRPGSRFSQLTQSGAPLMVKQLARSASELLLLLELNHRDSREDPWNPVPHILSAVERDDSVYLCMQGLHEFNEPALLSVAHYVDFFRQTLEGLAFLHEQRVSGLACSDPSSYMVDLSSAPHSLLQGDSNKFDRFSYPVRYYFVNFTEASRVPREAMSPLSNPGTPSLSRTRPTCPFKRDVQDLGAFFDSLLLEVPQISQKFKSLIRAMTLGGFTADDSRRLFEAMCRTLEAHVFESKATLFTNRSVPERAHTLAHPRSPSALSSRFPPLEKISSH